MPRLVAIALLIVVAVLAASAPHVARSASFTVTRFDDPAPHGCAPDDCSLREAIIAANASPGADTISLPAGTYALSIAPTNGDDESTGDLNIREAVSITGEGADSTIIDAAGIHGVIQIAAPPADVVTLSHLQVRGGAGFYGGILSSSGTVNIEDVVVRDNAVDYGAAGGIQNAGTMVIADSSVSHNTGGAAAGIGNEVGGDLTIMNTTVSDNTGKNFAGGIENDQGAQLTVDKSIINSNVSPSIGGGIANFGDASITNSSVEGNTATFGGGGGIYNATAKAHLEISNSTIGGNTGADGGGLHNEDAATAHISQSTISNNMVREFGGGIANASSLTVEASVIEGNESFLGGGVMNLPAGAVAELSDTSVRANHASQYGGGIFNYQSDNEPASLSIAGGDVSENSSGIAGGGITNYAALTISNGTVVEGNAAGSDGGGIDQRGGGLEIDSTTIRFNAASGNGGGIWSGVGYYVQGSLAISHSTIDSNSAQRGGGLWDEGVATISESAISDNTASDGGGGGIWGAGADIVLTNSTISGNTASGDGGGILYCYCRFRNVTIARNTAAGNGGGVMLGSPDVLDACCAESRNTIISENTDAGGEMPNLGCENGTLISQGYNLIQDIFIPPPEENGCQVTGDTTGNIIGQDAMLGPLADNGGPTFTHALLLGSPAVDAGNPQTPGSGGFSCEAQDQRGIARPQGPACDIGAYESPPSTDTDGDGCTDQQEAGPNERLGGRRDYLNPWDYFNPTHDGRNRIDDVLAVIRHYGLNQGDLGYSVDYDRTYIGPNPWNLGPPDGKIRLADILEQLRQYHHDCA